MILKANSRASGRNLALHLLNVEDNEHAVVHELSGFTADDLIGAFGEIEAISQGTKCQQCLFSLSLSPPKSANVSVTEFEGTIAEIEKRLGLAGQARAIVFHEKNGRRHAHCVWSRIDVATMKAINLSHYKRKLTSMSRELYIEHNWEMPAGLKNKKDRSQNEYTHIEAEQAKRVDRDPAELKKLFRQCWEASDSQSAFAVALWEKGFCFARGNRRGFVAVDRNGKVYSLSRWCGVKTKELKARFGNLADLPDVEEALALLQRQEQSDDTIIDLAELENQHHETLAAVVERQRNERKGLIANQEEVRVNQLREANAKLPKGVKALWAKITGAWEEHVKELNVQTEALKQNQQRETQALIEKHLSERQELDRKFQYEKAKLTLEAEVSGERDFDTAPLLRPDPRQPLILPREPVPFTLSQLKANPELILDYINDKQARFTHDDILRGLVQFIGDALELRIASDAVFASSELVLLGSKEKQEYTTRSFQKIEQNLQAHIAEMVELGGFAVKSSNIQQAIKSENAILKKKVGASLSQEQVDAIHHILQPNQLSSVVGLAGTGKSTLLSVAREAWEKQGYRVHGLALAGKAADSLQSSSGIKSRTIASLQTSWDNGYEPIEAGNIIVLDEAGMVGTRQLAKLREQLQQRGCKLVLAGDPDQLQPIEAGTPFRDIVANHKTAKLTEVRRQQSEWQRQASCDLASGNVEMALRNYSDHGAVHQTSSRDHAIGKLVTDYVQDLKEHGISKSRLALAHRRKDVYAINQAIRTRLQAEGKLRNEHLFKTDHGPRAIAKGDRLLFTRNDQNLGVRNGMLATVKKVDKKQITVLLDGASGTDTKRVTFSPSQFPHIDHGYAVTIHRSQGSTVDRSFVLSSETLDDNLAYVALTRHKQEANFYTAPEVTMNFERTFNLQVTNHEKSKNIRVRRR